MIKLTDLLKELNLDELELRPGNLSVNDNKTYYTFLEDFRIPEDEFFDTVPGKFNSTDLVLKPDAKFNPNLIKKRVLNEDGPYQLIIPSTYTGTLYLINSKGTDLITYIIGTVDVDVITVTGNRWKPFNITGAEIHLTYVTEPWRDKGWGTKMYYMLLEIYSNVFSDNILYEGSLSIWAKKIAPLGAQSGNFFGAEVGGIVVPMSSDDVMNTNLLKDVGLDHFIISIDPPQVLLDIKRKLINLSLSGGDYGVFEPQMKIKVSQLQDIVDEAVSMEEIFDKADLNQILGVLDDSQYSTIVVALQDAMVIISEGDDDVTMDII